MRNMSMKLCMMSIICIDDYKVVLVDYRVGVKTQNSVPLLTYTDKDIHKLTTCVPFV